MSPLKHSIKQQTIPVWNILIALPASAALLPPPACCHRRRRAAVNDAVAFIFIVLVIAVIVAVSVTVAAAAFSGLLLFFCPRHRRDGNKDTGGLVDEEEGIGRRPTDDKNEVIANAKFRE